MTTLALTFNGVTLSPISHKNQTWLSAAELSKALGYAKSDAVSQVYDRNSDEFNDSMTTVLRDTQIEGLGKNSGLQKERRIFSLRGCHLVAMFAKTAIAKRFRVWVLDILDKEVNQKPYALRDLPAKTLTPAMLLHITKQVKWLVKNQIGTSYGVLGGEILEKFNVNKRENIPLEKYREVCAFLGCEPDAKALQGELVEPVVQAYQPPKGMRLISESEFEALGKSVKVTQIPADSVIISAEKYMDLERYSLKNQFDDFVKMVEQKGGKVLMPSEVKTVKGIFKA